MSTKTKITEEQGIHRQWYLDAKTTTEDSLGEFVRHMIWDYDHDYGTIVHACAAAAIAAATAIHKSPTGGITGFQAGCIMWQFVASWLSLEDQPLRMTKFEEMLYPQNEFQFQKTIEAGTWNWLQEKAKAKLQDHPDAHERVLSHWQSIVAGHVPFGYRVKED